MPSFIQVRKAVCRDADIISEFQQAMALETEEKPLDPPVINRGVRRMMEQPQYGCYLVAEIDGRIAGSLMLTYEWSDWRDGLFWWIQSVYVPLAFRRQGVYKTLYRWVEAEAKKTADVIGIRLYVEKENRIAKQTYESLGMHAGTYEIYERVLD